MTCAIPVETFEDVSRTCRWVELLVVLLVLVALALLLFCCCCFQASFWCRILQRALPHLGCGFRACLWWLGYQTAWWLGVVCMVTPSRAVPERL